MTKRILEGVCVAALSAVALAGCQSPTAIYEGTVAACVRDCKHTDKDVAAAAAEGSQVVNLPITRLTIAPAPKSRDERTEDSGSRGGGNKPPGGGRPGGGAPGNTPGNDNAAETGGAKFAMKLSPVESDDIFRIRGATSFWSDTNIQITRLDNTDIVKSVQVDFRDDTPARIQQVFGLLSAVGGIPKLTGGPSKGPNTEGLPRGRNCKDAVLAPLSVDLSANKVADLMTTGLEFPDEGATARCWKLTLRPVGRAAHDVVVRTNFVGEVQRGEKLKTFPYPACLNVSVSLTKLDDDGTDKELFEGETPIIDPRYLRLARLPEKGKIEMHPICNANQSSSQVPDVLKGYFDAIDAVLGGLKPSQGSKPSGKP